MKNIVYNAVLCLDCGEKLVSRHVHDYKTCSCPNEAMVDGGLEYERYGAKNFDRIVKETLYDTDDYQMVRIYATRGSRGKDNKQPLTWSPLCAMEDDYLQAVIDYYPEGTDNAHLNLIRKEIEYRGLKCEECGRINTSHDEKCSQKKKLEYFEKYK
jgi:hypothetical protein